MCIWVPKHWGFKAVFIKDGICKGTDAERALQMPKRALLTSEVGWKMKEGQ